MALTLKQLDAKVTALRQEFEAARAIVLGYIATHGSLPQPPVVIPPVVVPPVVVPPAPAGDPNDPALFVMPAGANLNDAAVRDGLIRYAARICNHVEATEAQLGYWREVWPGLVARGIELHMDDYVWKKLIGWQATGADKPRYGPYR